MRGRIVLSSLIVAVASAAVASAHGPVCGPSKAHTLAADRLARVYSQGGTVYGCAKGSHSSYVLGSASPSATRQHGRVGPIALAGVDVAFGRTTSGVDVISAEVLVKNLTDGRVLRDHSATAGNFGAETAQRVDSIVVKPDGSVAWIATISSIISTRGTTQVRKSDRTQRTSLDSSPKIKPDSLRLHRSELRWRNGSVTKTATLR
ncbi:MAG TPA: hypothetical protein VGF70_03290 [Solirubrobacteraceae bacterium]|jgi:hypothetical protein